MRLRTLHDPDHLPALDAEYAHTRPAMSLGLSDPPPQILLLYGSLRARSFSRLATKKRRGYCTISALRRVSSIRRICRSPIKSRTMSIRLCGSYASMHCGSKARSGADLNGTVRSPG
jgi:hypothetical protein